MNTDSGRVVWSWLQSFRLHHFHPAGLSLGGGSIVHVTTTAWRGIIMKSNHHNRVAGLCFGALLSFTLAISSPGQVPNRLSFNGQQVWVKGVNLPWYNYTDFGNHYQWGNMYNSAEMESRLSAIAAKNFNTVRIWVYGDGRTSPEWSGATPGGSPTGHDTQFFANMDDFLARCSSKNLYVILTLWDHGALNSNPSAGQYAGHHESVITDSTKRAAWMNNVIGPLVSRYSQHARILSWEVFNEPEWNCSDLPGGGSTTYKVTTSQMQQFLA